ncbi:hypothetical protein [Burkholderia gladioli]|uniref:hypothetical protein n=1 Tax=Burkholderia gladioli TaxID=28095 RepID=UPI00163FAAAC|nr:hypothetical protein [Burkholderia gladioli]
MTFNPLTTVNEHPGAQEVPHSIVDAAGSQLHRDLPLHACTRLVEDYRKTDASLASTLRIVPTAVASAPAPGSNPNVPADHFLPGLLTHPGQPKLYQVVAPDGRVVINFLPHDIAWSFTSALQQRCPGQRFTFQEVPAEQLGVIA